MQTYEYIYPFYNFNTSQGELYYDFLIFNPKKKIAVIKFFWSNTVINN